MKISLTKRRWERGWSDLMRLGLLMRRMALDWTLSRRQRVDFGAPPQTLEQYSKEARIWDLYINRRWEDEKNPRALARKPSFWDACSAREWMWVFQVRLNERERPNYVREAEVSSSSPFMKTAGQSWLSLREMAARFVLLWLNETRLPLPHFSISVRSLERRKTEMFLWSRISQAVWSWIWRSIISKGVNECTI